MRRMIAVLMSVCLFCAAFSTQTSALAVEKRTPLPDGTSPVSPWEYQRLLGKGMDVDWCKTKEGMENYRSQAADDFAAAGISHVRIRVKEEADEQLLLFLRQVVHDCLTRGIIPVIAYQADEMKNDPSDKNLKKVEKWWRTTAAYFQDTSYLLSFDLIIEVTDELNRQPERLNEIYETLVSAVRETNASRILMISPRYRSDASYLADLQIPSQANGYLMAEWHFYAAGPSKTNERKLWTTGTAEERRLAQDKIDLALSWQAQHNIPTWVGAWMPGNYNDGNDYSISEQVVFAGFLSETLEKAGIPFAVNADTHFYDRKNGSWIVEMAPVFESIFQTADTAAFSDVLPSDWFYQAVEYTRKSGLFTGTSAGIFAPNETMTRGQMFVVLARMRGVVVSSSEQARQWVTENSISDGRNPDASVSREQFVTLLWRCTGQPPAAGNVSQFGDSGFISDYAQAAMSWAVGQGVLAGTPNGLLEPSGSMTRAQAAQILMNCQNL